MTRAGDGRTVSLRAGVGYGLMIGGAALAFLWICRLGAGSLAPSPAGVAPARAARVPAPDALMHLLLALLVVILAARAVAALCRRWGQPPVIGEVIAGILLGPSVLGRLAPDVAGFLFPPAVIPLLGVLAQVGVVLFMFLVGTQVDSGHLRRRTHVAVAISHASIVAPFVLGAALALVLYPRLSTAAIPFGTFALFIGVAMSVTAFPVLARILKDRGLVQTEVGALAIGCAAVDDATAWCLLAVVVGVARAKLSSSFTTLALALVYVAVMLVVVRPLLRRVLLRGGNGGGTHPAAITIVLIGLVASALATEAIGIHALFGAFLLGALVPRDAGFTREIGDRMEDFVTVLLLPAFFAVTGLRTQIALLDGGEEWLLCLAVVAVACVGKFGGTLAAARLTGLGWAAAASLGVLMNTRGLMELIVLNVGLDLGLISPTLFAMMVLMAVVTTVATTPLLAALERRAALTDAESMRARAAS
jgi:Kef-type K+ transport system membrane component KefB